MRQRVQKLMAQAGLCSRRTAEQWMLDGRVTVNGLPARPGEQADPECDCIEVDGKPLTGDGKKVYLMLNTAASLPSGTAPRTRISRLSRAAYPTV